ncbi:MAG: phage late control D family protein [Acidimicrobiales bacterium]
MGDTTLLLEIDGEEVTVEGLVPLVEIFAEEAGDQADAATITARVEPGDDGEWTSMLDPLTTPRTPVVVQIARDGVTYRFEGRATEASWELDASGSSQLTVKALDRTSEMDAEEKVVAWPGMSDSAIATAVFSSYGFRTEVEDTPAGPDPDVHVVLQRATDWSFIRSLAAKWGYAAYLEADGDVVTGHFSAIDPLADPQGVLSLGFGGDATRVSVQVGLTAAHKVASARIPPLSDTAQSGESDGDEEPQGSTSLAGQASVLLSPDDVEGEVEPAAVASGLARQSALAAVLTAELDADAGGLLLRARRTVLVRGLGSLLSGQYLVQRVRHHVTTAGHTQEITLVRNAFGLKGDEAFAGGGLLGDLL